MAVMLVRFIDHLQALWREGRIELVSDPFSYRGHDRATVAIIS